MTEMTLAMRLMLDAQRWASGLTRAQGGMKGFVQRSRAELRSLRSDLTGITGQLAGVGIGFSAISSIMSSARMDKGLTQIRQTAGMTKVEVQRLRGELHRMARETGSNVDQLQSGFGQLVAGGLGFDQALPTLEAINVAMAVTGSEANTLASALQSAQTHFGFDLSRPGMALELLDKMTVAGRAGVIELEDLSGAFAAAAVNANKAGLTFDQTLALFEGLGTATTKDRLGTLVDSTLRLFTNDNYRKAAQKATGVSFYNQDGSGRNPIEVLQEIQQAYAKLETDKQRDTFIARAFGKTDLDTQKGLSLALSEGKLGEILRIAQDVETAANTLRKDLPEAIDNGVDAAARLKAVMGEAGDRFARPVNRAVVGVIDKLTGTGEGQLGLGGGQIAGLAVAGSLSALLAKRMGARGIDSLFNRFGGTARGVGQGKALEAAAGVTPVYVVNASEIGGGIAAAAGMPGAGGRRAGALDKLAGGTVAGVLGWEAGSMIYDNAIQGTQTGNGLGLYLSRMMAPFDAETQQTLNAEGTNVPAWRSALGGAMPFIGIMDAMLSSKEKEQSEQREMQKLEGVIRVEVTDNGTRVRSVESNQENVDLQVRMGRMMSAGGF